MTTERRPSTYSSIYRGATVQDLDPQPALSIHPSDLISYALLRAYENDYTHLTITHTQTRSLLGYLSIPRLRTLLSSQKLCESDPVSSAMQRFQRKGREYKVITMDSSLEELEEFFEGGFSAGERQGFAVVTDGGRRFVLGVVTEEDLKGFRERRAR